MKHSLNELPLRLQRKRGDLTSFKPLSCSRKKVRGVEGAGSEEGRPGERPVLLLGVPVRTPGKQI